MLAPAPREPAAVLTNTGPIQTTDPQGSIVAVAMDDLTIERLKMAVRTAGLDIPITSAKERSNLPAVPGVPTVYLVEWAEGRESEAADTCQTIRAASHPNDRYILAVGAVGERAGLVHALGSYADAVLTRPFGTEELIVKLRQAFHTLSTSPGSTIRAAIHEGITSKSGGEVVVRSESVVGTIHVRDGHIVWAHISSHPANIEEVLKYADLVLESEAIQAVKDECRQTGTHFMEVLVRWRLIDDGAAREAVRRFVTSRLELIFDLPNPTALFLPKSQAYRSPLRFHPDELPPAHGTAAPQRISTWEVDGPLTPKLQSPDPLVAPLGESEARDFSARLMELDGVVGAAVLDRKTGEFLARQGQPMNTDVVWCLLSALVRLGSKGDEVIAGAGEHLLLARPVRSNPSLILFVLSATDRVSLGLARSNLAQIATALHR